MEELDDAGLWQYQLPRVGAAEQSLIDLETYLGEPLDPRYRDFLSHANGWLDFHLSVDLFGTDELRGGPLMERARKQLSVIEDVVWSEVGLTESLVLPIAAAKYDPTLFVITRSAANCPGNVIWMTGSVIDKFENFDEFFLSMKEYNKILLAKLKSGWGRKDDIMRLVAQSRKSASFHSRGPDMPPTRPAN